jgi:hypothetical protein
MTDAGPTDGSIDEQSSPFSTETDRTDRQPVPGDITEGTRVRVTAAKHDPRSETTTEITIRGEVDRVERYTREDLCAVLIDEDGDRLRLFYDAYNDSEWHLEGDPARVTLPDTEANESEPNVPYEVPVVDVDADQLAAIEAFVNEYTERDGGHSNTTATAVIYGRKPTPTVSEHPDASVYGRDRVSAITLNGETIPFNGAARTSSKRTSSAEIHAAGYRLTIEYHNASGGSYHQLRVVSEEDI